MLGGLSVGAKNPIAMCKASRQSLRAETDFIWDNIWSCMAGVKLFCTENKPIQNMIENCLTRQQNEPNQFITIYNIPVALCLSTFGTHQRRKNLDGTLTVKSHQRS